MSRALKGLPAEEVKAALIGYKEHTYGGKKKGMMERVVKSLTDEDIEALATHIGTFLRIGPVQRAGLGPFLAKGWRTPFSGAHSINPEPRNQ